MSDQRKFWPNLFECVGVYWCRMMHNSPMWPIRGRYHCRSCGRAFLIPWANSVAAEPVRIWVRPEEHAVRRAA